MSSRLEINAPAEAPVAAGNSALWSLGFRPFYLLAAAFAAVSVPLWTARFADWMGLWVYDSDNAWHAHELIFGYAFAVITGFLFTAVRNWTGRPTPAGMALAGIAALWLAARMLVLTPWTWAAAVADTAFALAVAAGIGAPLLASGNRRHYFFIALVLVLGGVNLAFYYAKLLGHDIPVRVSVQVGLDLILCVIAVMGGRVIPAFTNNAIAGAGSVRVAAIETLSLGSVLLMIAADAAGQPLAVTSVVAAVAAFANGARLVLWRPWKTAGRPILWILHASYAWLVLHLALRALAPWDVVAPSLATHALTVGAIGGMTLGMMTRTARGHTGRPLVTGPLETAAYVLIQLAAVVRVFGPVVVPRAYVAAVVLSGALWTLAFAAFLVVYWPILARPRLDGKPG